MPVDRYSSSGSSSPCSSSSSPSPASSRAFLHAPLRHLFFFKSPQTSHRMRRATGHSVSEGPPSGPQQQPPVESPPRQSGSSGCCSLRPLSHALSSARAARSCRSGRGEGLLPSTPWPLSRAQCTTPRPPEAALSWPIASSRARRSRQMTARACRSPPTAKAARVRP